MSEDTKEQKSDKKKDAKLTTLERRKQYLNPSSKPLIETAYQHQHQQEVTIDFEIEQTDKADAEDTDTSSVFDRRSFCQFFSNTRTTLPPYVAKLAPGDIWDNLFGNIKVAENQSDLEGRENPTANRLTRAAAMQILFNYDRFPQGFDFYHPAPGFKLQSKILYYSPLFAASEELPDPKVYVRLRDIEEIKKTNESKSDEKKSRTELDEAAFKHATTKQERTNIEAWWEALYTADTANYTTDERQELVECFKKFLDHMKLLGLQLPALPPKNTQSLPVTLGYIVSLLEYLPAENRQAQLDLISELSLEGSGAIRALDKKKSDPNHCRFVHPAMGYEASQFNFVLASGYTGTPNFETGGYIDNHRDIYKTKELKEVKDTRKAFWRFVGHREGLSLSFYINAEEDIQKYKDPEIQKLLYALLAGMSTGASLLHGKNEQAVQECWEGLCRGIKKIPTDYHRKEFLRDLTDLELLPPAPLLKKILILTEKAAPGVTGVVWKQIKSKLQSTTSPLNKIQQAYRTLNWLLKLTREHIVADGQPAIYQGMRFSYENKEVKDGKDPFTDVDNSLFYSYLEQIKNIQKMYFDSRNRKLGAPYVRPEDTLFILRSYETFHLNKDQIENFFERVNRLDVPDYFYQQYGSNRSDAIHALKDSVFRLLEHIDNNTGLSKASLDNILERIKTIGFNTTGDTTPEDQMLAMIGYLQRTHPNNFPPGYLKQQKDIYECKGLSAEIVAKINEAFKDEEQNQCVKNLLAKHNNPEDRCYQEDTVDLLKQLSSLYGYDNASFNEWLYQITEYKKARQNDDSLLDLNQVFLFMATEQNPLLLETLIYREDRDRIPHLVQKCSFLQETLQPWLKENSTRLSQASTYQAMVEASIPIDPTKLDDSLLKEEKETETDLLLKETETEGDRLVDELGRLLKEESENHEKINAAVEKLLRRRTFQRSAALWESWQYFKDSKPSIEPPLPPQSWEEGAMTSTPLSISSSSTESTPTEEKKEEKKKDKKINVDHPKEKIASMLQVAANSMGEAVKNAGGFFKSLLWKSNKEQALVPEENKKNSVPVGPPKKLEPPKSESILIGPPVLDKKNPEPPKEEKKSLFGSITSTITNLLPTKPKPEEQLKEQIQGKQYKDIYLQLKHFVGVEIERRTSYRRFFLDYYERMYRLAETHPCIKKDLFNYISHFSKKYSPPDEKKKNEKRHLNYVKVLRQQIMCLENAAKKLEDPELRRLLYSYQQKEANPQELINTLSNIEAVKNTKNRESLYKLFSKFSGETILKPDAFSRLCKLADDSPDIFAAVQACYDNPPYISLNTVLSWANLPDSKQSSPQTISMQAANIAAEYAKKDKEPFKRKKKNIFNCENAKKQAKLFQGTEVFKDETIIDELDSQITKYRNMSTRAKIAALEKFKTDNAPGDQQDRTATALTPKLTAQLTALLGELLYATSDQELNATQYLTLYSSLSSQGSSTYQVVTGGGKSRITMALCAGLNILGKNVDFATKNWDLAEREFYTNRHFFQACDIPTQLVNVNTSAKEYLHKDSNDSKDKDNNKPKNPGIHFSSKHQLALFHNQIFSSTKADAKEIFTLLKDSVLVGDEADLLYYENGREHVIFAKPLENKKLGDLSWIYPWLLKFIDDDAFERNYLDADTDLIYRFFRQWMATFTALPKEHKEVLRNIQDPQLEVWFRSAIQVRDKLQEGVAFDGVIGRDQPKWTRHGLRLVSSAVVKADNALAWESSYSDGVQQLLNVRLNNQRSKERAQGHPISRTPYEVDEESFAIYSSTMSTLLNRYGMIQGFTGTAGSIDKRHEVVSKCKMSFVDVPLHYPSQRVDLPMRIGADKEHQWELLYKDIIEAREEHRPVLVICENDNESQAFLNYCNSRGLPIDQRQRVHGATDMKEATKEAGKDGMVTITTDIMGRGTDIELDENGRGQEKGLRGLCTYLPEEDDETQIIGRVARNGKPGDFRFVLDMPRLKARLGIPPETPISEAALMELCLNRSAFLRYHQNKLDWDKQDVRVVYQRVNALSDRITHHFFTALQEQDELSKEALTTDWVNFNKQLKDEVLTPELDTINKLLHTKEEGYQDKVKNQLESLMPEIVDSYCNFFQEKFGAKINLDHFKPTEQDMAALKAQLSAARIKLPYQNKTSKEWDEGHGGQNVVYHDKLFAHTRAVLQGKTSSWTELFWRTDHRSAHEKGTGLRSPEYTAWAHNKRLLFANSRAWLAGDLNEEREQLNKALRGLYAALLTRPTYKDEVERLLNEVSRLSLGADKKMFDLLIQTVNNTAEFIRDPQQSKANYEQRMAEIQKDRRVERLQETALGILSLGLTLTCVEVAMNALPQEIPHVLSLDFSMIPNDIALKLAIAGASVGLLLVMMYLVKSFATHTAGLQSAMGSVAAEKVQGSATGVALATTPA